MYRFGDPDCQPAPRPPVEDARNSALSQDKNDSLARRERRIVAGQYSSDAESEYLERLAHRDISVVDKVLVAAGVAVVTCSLFIF